MAQPSTTRIAPDLPTGAVRLLVRALAAEDRRWRPVWWLRALHLAWTVTSSDTDARRVVCEHAGDELVGVAVAVRYDAGPRPLHLVMLTLRVLVLGAVLELLSATVPTVVLVATVLGLAAGAAVAAVLHDGPRGRHAARTATTRASELGADRAWGRGLVAVAPRHQGRGTGTRVTTALVASLPAGHHWLPVARTATALRLYRRLGGRRLAGSAAVEVPADGLQLDVAA